MHDFMNSDHDIYDPQSKDGPLEIGICYKGNNLRIPVCEEISIPETQPWQPEKEDPDLDGEENIYDSKDSDYDRGALPESVASAQFLRMGWNPSLQH